LHKNFTLYAAILAVLALLLFLSPQIAKLISADTDQTPEILKNIDFAHEKLNDRVWSFNMGNDANTVKFDKGKMLVGNEISKGNFTLVAQRLELSDNKYYSLELAYNWRNSKLISDVASFGVMKQGLNSEIAQIYPISNTGKQSEVVKYFHPDSTFRDPYFYLLVEGTGTFEISTLSIKQLNSLPGGASVDPASNQILPIRILPVEPAAKTPLPSPTKTNSILAAASPSPKPSPSSTPTSTPLATTDQKTTNYIAYPGWNITTIENDVATEIFTQQGLTVFQNFAGVWHKVMPDGENFTLSPLGAVYVYNPQDENKTIAIGKSQVAADFKVGKRWNLLASFSEIKSDSSLEAYGLNDTLSNLIKNKRVSRDIYLLTSTPTGVQMKKIDPESESIPAKSAFWLYLF